MKKGLITPPKWLPNNTQLLTIMGSEAYGVSSGSSDIDIYGFTIPAKHMVFPHLAGHVPDFGTDPAKFNVWQQHHVFDNDKEYDLCVYGIVKFFQLCMDNNPNMIDSLFTPRRCVIHTTKVGEHVRANRKKFLHKKSWHTFKGYAYKQMSKIDNKSNASNPERAASIAEFGFDVKFAYHVVRLLNEVEQILVEGDLDLERNREQLKAIRRGEWSLEKIKAYFEEKESALETTYANSPLPHGPNEEEIKNILLECLEMHYGNIDSIIQRDVSIDIILTELQQVLDKYK